MQNFILSEFLAVFTAIGGVLLIAVAFLGGHGLTTTDLLLIALMCFVAGVSLGIWRVASILEDAHADEDDDTP